jgi:hypothetical protein
MRRSPFAVLGVAGIVLGCAAMVSMLPAAAAGVLGTLGITGSSALARTLSPVAEPLFIASAALILISALTCSRLVVVLSAAGSVLLYLSMFQLATVASTGTASDPGPTSMMGIHESAQADAPTFYLGLVLLVVAAGLAAWRRHRHECQPVLGFPPLHAARR